MKIKGYVALSLAWCIAVALWVWKMTTLAAETTIRNVWIDLDNAVQHMVNVRILCAENDNECINAGESVKSVLKLAGTNLVWVQTNNFILSKDESTLKSGEKMNTIDGSLSNILWGVSNKIDGWIASTILWWESNTNKGSYSTILWWEGNNINGNNSTIVGWSGNVLNGNYSVIVGWRWDEWKENSIVWNYSVVLWNGSSVKWNNSVALWKNSKIKNSNNSFLWTDGSKGPLENVSNVFVVNSEHWMVVNANKAHPLAQLTVGWPLVIHESNTDLECTDSWVIKVVSWEDRDTERKYKCFCGCDGNGYWHSLYGQWRCEWKCNKSEHPAGCKENTDQWWDGEGTYHMSEDGTQYIWHCNIYSRPVRWEKAYAIDQQGTLRWTCQTNAWLTARCHASTKG